ncbi:hypothetical protein JL722_6220 [Aureococcus anophagefferens]|nr:hypothetical protein JL722_6220 [Aureococcus anophagefferens]
MGADVTSGKYDGAPSGGDTRGEFPVGFLKPTVAPTAEPTRDTLSLRVLSRDRDFGDTILTGSSRASPSGGTRTSAEAAGSCPASGSRSSSPTRAPIATRTAPSSSRSAGPPGATTPSTARTGAGAADGEAPRRPPARDNDASGSRLYKESSGSTDTFFVDETLKAADQCVDSPVWRAGDDDPDAQDARDCRWAGERYACETPGRYAEYPPGACYAYAGVLWADADWPTPRARDDLRLPRDPRALRLPLKTYEVDKDFDDTMLYDVELPLTCRAATPTTSLYADTVNKAANFDATGLVQRSRRRSRASPARSGRSRALDPRPHAGNYPDADLGDHNECRDPDGSGQAWCYTTSPAVRREFCDPDLTRKAWLDALYATDFFMKRGYSYDFGYGLLDVLLYKGSELYDVVVAYATMETGDKYYVDYDVPAALEPGHDYKLRAIEYTRGYDEESVTFPVNDNLDYEPSTSPTPAPSHTGLAMVLRKKDKGSQPGTLILTGPGAGFPNSVAPGEQVTLTLAFTGRSRDQNGLMVVQLCRGARDSTCAPAYPPDDSGRGTGAASNKIGFVKDVSVSKTAGTEKVVTFTIPEGIAPGDDYRFMARDRGAMYDTRPLYKGAEAGKFYEFVQVSDSFVVAYYAPTPHPSPQPTQRPTTPRPTAATVVFDPAPRSWIVGKRETVALKATGPRDRAVVDVLLYGCAVVTATPGPSACAHADESMASGGCAGDSAVVLEYGIDVAPGADTVKTVEIPAALADGDRYVYAADAANEYAVDTHAFKFRAVRPTPAPTLKPTAATLGFPDLPLHVKPGETLELAVAFYDDPELAPDESRMDCVLYKTEDLASTTAAYVAPVLVIGEYVEVTPKTTALAMRARGAETPSSGATRSAASTRSAAWTSRRAPTSASSTRSRSRRRRRRRPSSPRPPTVEETVVVVQRDPQEPLAYGADDALVVGADVTLVVVAYGGDAHVVTVRMCVKKRLDSGRDFTAHLRDAADVECDAKKPIETLIVDASVGNTALDVPYTVPATFLGRDDVVFEISDATRRDAAIHRRLRVFEFAPPASPPARRRAHGRPDAVADGAVLAVELTEADEAPELGAGRVNAFVAGARAKLTMAYVGRLASVPAVASVRVCYRDRPRIAAYYDSLAENGLGECDGAVLLASAVKVPVGGASVYVALPPTPEGRLHASLRVDSAPDRSTFSELGADAPSDRDVVRDRLVYESMTFDVVADASELSLDPASTWLKKGTAADDCDWVARNTAERCVKHDEDGILATEGCPNTCADYEPPAPTAAPSLPWPTPAPNTAPPTARRRRPDPMPTLHMPTPAPVTEEVLVERACQADIDAWTACVEAAGVDLTRRERDG